MDDEGIIPMPDTEDTRFAYVALFRAHIEGYQAPAKYYKLGLLLSRKHATIESGYARITDAGIEYWARQVAKTWSVNQRMSGTLASYVNMVKKASGE